MALVRVLPLALSAAAALAGPTSAELYRPREAIAYAPPALPATLAYTSGAAGATVRGTFEGAAFTLRLAPPAGTWDLSAWSYARVDFANAGDHPVWIEAQLENADAQSWKNSCLGQAIALPGEQATVGIPITRRGDLYDGSAIFREMAGRPNGFRSHWRSFDPARVTGLRLAVHAPGKVLLSNLVFSAAYPYGSATNAVLEALPFLDRFGQVRQVEWPGKLPDEAELAARRKTEDAALARAPGVPGVDRFGGWIDGPCLSSNGHFRVEKRDDRWWLVDPEGRLFWSLGCNAVGFSASTPVARREALFAWLPPDGDPLRPDILTGAPGALRADFYAGNLRRKYGPAWREVLPGRVQQRMRSWGLNTLGAWCDESVSRLRQTPYTPCLYVWSAGLPGVEHLPDPFEAGYRARIREAAEKLRAGIGDDPWCLGVFVDNEVDWQENLVERVFAAPPAQPAKRAFAERLRAAHGTIEKLNAAWGTAWTDWDALLPSQKVARTAACATDFDALYQEYAEAYYRACREEFKAVFPAHLYLGSRIHRCPEVVARAAAKYVDVYSINLYAFTAGAGTLPRDEDKPVLITEWHFGALDRGVPGQGLYTAHDQVQRARAFAHYVTSGLLHPRIVGAHWFAYADQSAAGRPGENYQIGFVDVTDTPYPEITAMARALAARMYPLRAGGGADSVAAAAPVFEAARDGRP